MKSIGKKIIIILIWLLALPFIWKTSAYTAWDKYLEFNVWVPVWFNQTVQTILVEDDWKVLVWWGFIWYKWLNVNRVVRLNTNWTRDTGFNIPWFFNSSIYQIKKQSDWKLIILWGFTNYSWTTINRIVRLNTDWTIDNSFNVWSWFNNTTFSLEIQSDWKILIWWGFTVYNWTSINRIVRLNTDWTIDNSFNVWSWFDKTVNSMTIQPDWKIVVWWSFTNYNWTEKSKIIRLNTGWTVDDSFNIWSWIDPALWNDVYVITLSSGWKILVWGGFSLYSWTSVSRVVRLNTDWTRDTGFSPWNFGSNVRIITEQSDWKILFWWDFTTYSWWVANRLVRLNSDWSIDNSFHASEDFLYPVYSIWIRPDNKIIVWWQISNSINLLNIDWSVDTGFEIWDWFNNEVRVAIEQPDWKILVWWTFSKYWMQNKNLIARLNTDWTIDNSFNMWTWFAWYMVYAMALQDDWKIIVWWSFQSYKWFASSNLIRLNSDWTIDNSFNVWGWFNSEVRSIVIQPDEKILVWWYFTNYSWVVVNKIVRLNTGWTRDSNFSAKTFNSTTVYVYTLALQDDWKIIVWWDFTTYSWWFSAGRIMRINPDWTKDNSFTWSFNNYVQTVKIQTDWKILVWWYFDTYNLVSSSRLARINPDWTRDTSFSTGSPVAYVRSIDIQSDWKIIVWWDWGVRRISSTWLIDSGFNIWSWLNSQVWSVNIQLSWRILVWWRFTTYNNNPAWYLISLFDRWLVPYLLDNSYVNITWTYIGSSWLDFSLIRNKLWVPFLESVAVKMTNPSNQDYSVQFQPNTKFSFQDTWTDYTWVLAAPSPISTWSVSGVPWNPNIYAWVRVWNWHRISLLTTWWQALPATITIPVDSSLNWQQMNVYYSEDAWATWDIMTAAKVTAWLVTFQTPHFTDFVIWGSNTWSFVINNDDVSTYNQNVVLLLNATWATHARFRNELWTRSAWLPYTATYNRTLSAWYGTKTVNVEIDTDSNWVADVLTSDTIQWLAGLPWQVEWNLSLQILTWISECIYWTSIYLWAQDVKLNEAYSFSGAFSGTWYCADYKGYTGWWAFTIQTSDLTNGRWSVISSGNLLISHNPVSVSGDVACTWWAWTAITFSTAPYTMFEKAPDVDKLCRVATTNVWLEINVPANQSPWSYSGTLTIYIPNFY